MQNCDVYAFCGAFGVCNQRGIPLCTCIHGFEPRSPKDWNLSDYSSGGCVRKSSLQCGHRDAFSLMSNVKLPANPRNLSVASAHDCKLACSDSCSCTAYTYSNNECSIWNGDLFNLQQISSGEAGGEDLYLRLAASDIQKPGGKKKKENVVVIGGALAGVVAFLGLVLFCRLAASDILKSGGKKKEADTGVVVETVAGFVALLGLILFSICVVDETLP
ncbi:G-type lectin S-receptor-like serine/threonine-protein kinase [Thalictrum thalictroides]|uniref:G-type lectin S-receptor-like serine/threonine-protein kinase n=1 Tax=Thalictrum thalictroides TaxID=46969 RepID=A0A7J6VW91_THATH|nr:G-type lectin S-receptor-like serine/threonine-protein kinase [Thalictrum thalictroides]